MNDVLRNFLLSGLILISVSVSAQNKKSIEKATTLFENQEYYQAAPLFENLYSASTTDADKALYALNAGDCYAGFLDFEKAALWYDKSLQANPNPTTELRLADMQLASGQYSNALEHYNNLIASSHDKSTLKNRVESCNYAINQLRKTPEYEIINVSALNTGGSEYSPIIYGGRMIFSSSRFGSDSDRIFNFDGQGFSDLFVATYDSLLQKWGDIKKLPSAVNGKFNEGTASYAATDAELYFMRCNDDNGKGKLCKILKGRYNPVTNDAGRISELILFGKDVSTGHPALNSAGNVLFFVSDNLEGIGGKDIYVSTRNERGEWSEPRNPGIKINTAGDDMFPVLSGDTILYFSSNGRVGMGGLDIFKVKVNGSNLIGDPTALPWPINTSGDDFGYCPAGNDYGYFSSNRYGGTGHDDIYFCRPAPFMLSARGKVTDKLSHEPIANAIIIIKLNNEIIDTTKTNEAGEYFISNILSNKTYELLAVKEGYIPQNKTLSTNGESKTRELSKATGHDIDFELFKITRDEIVINNIYYDFDKWDLREESKRELDKILTILNENPQMQIQINSHTDDRGTDEYNFYLSEKRAESVVNYLISAGIDKKRLMFKGWGESRLLIAHAETEEEHQLNRRTTFNLMNISDYNSDYYEKIYAEIDKGIQKTRVSMFFRIYIGTNGDESLNRNLETTKQFFPNAPLVVTSEDGQSRSYMGAYIFMDEAMEALAQLQAKGLSGCYIAAFRNEQKVGIIKLQ
jgi:outer membrane protein OmpA-like peptidoglycan-associated protein/tetratricopeptide (TPR) repeat protein